MNRLVLITLQERVFLDRCIYCLSAELHSCVVLDPEYKLCARRLTLRNELENLGKVFLILTLLVGSINDYRTHSRRRVLRYQKKDCELISEQRTRKGTSRLKKRWCKCLEHGLGIRFYVQGEKVLAKIAAVLVEAF